MQHLRTEGAVAGPAARPQRVLRALEGRIEVRRPGRSERCDDLAGDRVATLEGVAGRPDEALAVCGQLQRLPPPAARRGRRLGGHAESPSSAATCTMSAT